MKIDSPTPNNTIRFYRFDNDLEKCHSLADFLQLNQSYDKKVGDLYAYYTAECLRLGMPDDSSTAENLMLFKNDKYMAEVNTAIAEKFIQDPFKAEIKQAFAFLKYYFPKGEIPEAIVYYNSAFTNSVISSHDAVGIGLERYLGKRNHVIKQLSSQVFFDYIKEKMDAQFLVRDVLFSWIDANYFSPDDDSKVLAERMITLGKVYYLTEACMPELDKSILLRYDDKEYTWADVNEGNFWRFLVEQNALFKHNSTIASNIFNDGPFTPGLPIEDKAPARLGHYLGWKIVKGFMDEHPEITLKQLILLDYKQILKSYKTFN